MAEVKFTAIVTDKETKQEETLSITDEQLIERYGSVAEKPTPMLAKDTSCRTGVFSWGRYTKLKVKQIRRVQP